MRLNFTLDPQVIHHIIHSQAGSIGKAIIELVMNSVDARATRLALTLDANGFVAQDDGLGFASREDVVRYFGRFGTPHEEGDATFGRFRLGRGQIMAHASTIWQSRRWQMSVDTREMGYAYDLDELSEATNGCRIQGAWYEPLETMELYEVLQELRDLVRYTPMSVELNGKRITKDPATETWDHQDDLAYYRFRREGSVAIYNQGVLVRHDPGHTWGAGGMIVSKQAIGLNVSRTEILRKSCPAWKAIAKQAKELARQYAEDDSLRKGENARTHAARRIKVAQGQELEDLLSKEAVLTLLPGSRHLNFRRLPSACALLSAAPAWQRSLAQAENIAASRMALVLHPRTLERFECSDLVEFEALWADLRQRIVEHHHNGTSQNRWLTEHLLQVLDRYTFVPYEVLQKNFKMDTQVISDKTLDPEVRRAWRALRWCLDNYAALVLTGNPDHCQQNGRIYHREQSLLILVGRANSAAAWTDGQSYIAINENEIKALSGGGLRAAMRIFALMDHELAHEGDSLDATHDEAFFNRYHELSINFAGAKQAYLHHWAYKYGLSLERGKRAGWARRHLTAIERVKRAEGDESSFAVPMADGEPALTPEPSEAILAFINAGLGAQPSKGIDPDKLRADLEDFRQNEAHANLISEEHQDLYEAEEPDCEEEPYIEQLSEEDALEYARYLAEEQTEKERRKAEEARQQIELAQLLGREPTPEERARLTASLAAPEPYDLLEFVRQQGRMPFQEKWRGGEELVEGELWSWAWCDKPTVPAGVNLLVLERLARNIGMPLKDYLAQHQADAF